MGTLICRIELKKEQGITLTVQNDEGQITQTVEMTGEVIKLTCKGKSEEETSVITQRTDGVEVKCKMFEVKAESVTITSTKDTLVQSEEKLDLKSTKAMTLSSDDKLDASAKADLALSGNNVQASAQSKAELNGQNTDVAAKLGLKMSGGTTELTGQQKIDISGAPMISVTSKAMLTLEGKMTTVSGKMTNVDGQLIKMG